MLHVDEGMIHAYLDGELATVAGERHVDIEAHLAACPECAARLEQARRYRRAARTILGAAGPEPGEPPPFDDILSRARSEPVPSERSLRRSRPGRPPLRTLAWAASLVLALGAGWLARDALDAGAPEMTRAAKPPGTAGAPLEVAEEPGATAERGFASTREPVGSEVAASADRAASSAMSAPSTGVDRNAGTVDYPATVKLAGASPDTALRSQGSADVQHAEAAIGGIATTSVAAGRDAMAGALPTADGTVVAPARAAEPKIARREADEQLRPARDDALPQRAKAAAATSAQASIPASDAGGRSVRAPSLAAAVPAAADSVTATDAVAERGAAGRTIRGKVLDDQTGAPLAGGRIRLVDQDGAIVRSAPSDPDGGFMFSNLLPGTYSIVADRDGYDAGRRTIVVEDGGGVLIVELSLRRSKP